MLVFIDLKAVRFGSTYVRKSFDSLGVKLVPILDSDLFSVTKHRRMDHSHSFILERGNMHLSFLKFSITQPIPKNDDLRVPLQPMSIDNWSIPNYILNGHNYSDDYLSSYKN